MWRQLVTARVAQLEQGFATVAPRMRSLGLARPGLQVQALDFEPLDEMSELLLGVLVTPWCLNLMLLPLRHCDRPTPAMIQPRQFGDWTLEFQTGTLAEPGAYASCSLFSDMARFADQAAARETGEACLRVLRESAVVTPVAGPVAAPAALLPLTPAAPSDPASSRRGFLFGRSASLRA